MEAGRDAPLRASVRRRPLHAAARGHHRKDRFRAWRQPALVAVPLADGRRARQGHGHALHLQPGARAGGRAGRRVGGYLPRPKAWPWPWPPAFAPAADVTPAEVASPRPEPCALALPPAAAFDVPDLPLATTLPPAAEVIPLALFEAGPTLPRPGWTPTMWPSCTH